MIDIKLARAKYDKHVKHTIGKTDRFGNPVEMRLTFEEWLAIWEASGMWDQRGRLKGMYCMARIGDIGHYETGNVRIITNGDNAREAVEWREYSDETRQRLVDANVRRQSYIPMHEANRGRPLSATHRRNLSIATTGRESPFKGKTHSPEAKALLRSRALGRSMPQGVRDAIGAKVSATRWYNDGTKNYRLQPDDSRTKSLRPGRHISRE
jgi:hypothetical protein